jgi:hypothetical protein
MARTSGARIAKTAASTRMSVVYAGATASSSVAPRLELRKVGFDERRNQSAVASGRLRA